MFKHFRNTLLFTLLFAGPVMAQSIEGLKDIVSIQQEKILRMEDNIKKIGIKSIDLFLFLLYRLLLS